MAELIDTLDPALIANPAFSGVQKLVDVGGGDGSLLVALLDKHPTIHGVLFDLPQVVETARERIRAAGLASRCEIIAGSAFDGVPENADGYMLSRVLHDWDDERALAILRNCRRAIASEGKLFVVERILPDRFEPSEVAQSVAMTDLTMMVMTGGRERSRAEFRALLEDARFGINEVHVTASGVALVEAVAVPLA
jgi:ubiquinone/menaquinone biosynthesis C-methylase UbiE